VLCLIVIAPAVLCERYFSEQQYQHLFTHWFTQHKKSYSLQDFFQRFNIFKDNIDFIFNHNAGNYTYTLAANQFADLTVEEFRSYGHGYLPRNINDKRVHQEQADAPHLKVERPLASKDWRTLNAVTPVKNQGSCGSCWAFSTTGAVEGAHAIVSKTLVALSEQELVDCSKSGNMGCNGGLPSTAMQWIASNRGITAGTSYPYTGRDGVCKSVLPPAVATIKGPIQVSSEAAMLNAVNLGPVTVAVEADTQYFQFYSRGVFNDARCGTTLDHAVLVVGYNTDPTGGDYWIVKNSWAATWGNQGYIFIKRNVNMCGIGMEMVYPSGATTHN